jgi:hypothetical protein
MKNIFTLFGLAVHKNFGNIAYWLFMYWFAEIVKKLAVEYQNKVIELVNSFGGNSELIVEVAILILDFIKKIAQSYILSMHLFLPAMMIFFIFRIWVEDFKLKRKLKK